MLRNNKARSAVSVILAITAVTGASALGMGSAAHKAQTAAVKTASLTDTFYLLKLQVGVPTYIQGDGGHIWPTKYSGTA
ncbi:MAG: hypothetical protein ACXVFQ_23380 [Solirubrobacteraceae bacterium]